MRVFDDKIVDLLRPELGGEAIYFVGLGAFDFQFAFGNLLRVQNEQRVDFYLQGLEYKWEEGASGPLTAFGDVLPDRADDRGWQVSSDLAVRNTASVGAKMAQCRRRGASVTGDGAACDMSGF